MIRLQQDIIARDLSKKMVFLTGPRQVGKTSVAKSIAAFTEGSVYLNYDNFSHRDIIHQAAWLPDTRLLIKICGKSRRSGRGAGQSIDNGIRVQQIFQHHSGSRN